MKLITYACIAFAILNILSVALALYLAIFQGDAQGIGLTVILGAVLAGAGFRAASIGDHKTLKDRVLGVVTILAAGLPAVALVYVWATTRQLMILETALIAANIALSVPVIMRLLGKSAPYKPRVGTYS